MTDRVLSRNEYSTRCVDCGGIVPIGQGYYGKRDAANAVWCAIHKPADEVARGEVTGSADIYLDLSADDATVEIKLRGRHPSEAFRTYLDLKRSSGVRSTRDFDGNWRDSTTVPNIGRVWKALSDAGFAVVASPRLATSMRGAAAQQQADDAAVQARLSHPRATGLFPFQRVGVQWLASRTGAVLADEMGCGKTIQALMALGEKRPVLLVVPASLKLNWSKEAAKWRPEYRVSVLAGRGSFRWPSPGEILITNYDILPAAPERAEFGRLPPLTGVFERPPANLTVLADEAHALKDAKALRTNRFRFIGDVARSVGGQVWLLTGTPLLNRPQELWGIFSSGGVAKEAFGSFDNFKRLFNAEQGRFGIEWGPPEPEVPEHLRRVQLRREKKDVLADLPVKMRKLVPVSTEGLKARDTTLFDSVLRKLEDHERSKVRKASADSTKAIGEGMPGFEDFSRSLTALALAKTDAAIDYVETFIAEDQPFLVFSAHIEPLKRIKASIEKAGKKCGIIIGEVASDERQRVVDDFQAGRLDCVCIGIRAGGVGLTLTRAAHSVFVDLEVVPALNVQAEDRIHRIGQTRPVTIHQLVLNHPLDEHIHHLISAKMGLFGATVGASSYMPNEQAPTDSRASALTQAAAQVAVAAPTAKAAIQKPKVTKVEYTLPAGHKRAVAVARNAHPPISERELWAAEAIATLSGMDSDRAAMRNDVGWSAGDTSVGHMFNALIHAGVGLSDEQWITALEILRKYWRQVGKAPDLETEKPAAQKREKEARRELDKRPTHPAAPPPVVAPTAVAPVPPAAQGIGQVGKGAKGDVTCVSIAPNRLEFAASDGRRVVSAAAALPSNIRLAVGSVYSIWFRVVKHEPDAAGNIVTVTASVDVLADKTVVAAKLSSLNEMMREHRTTFGRYTGS